LGLKLTNNLEGSLFSFFGAFTIGIDWAKQILLPSFIIIKLSQSLYFPMLFTFSSALSVPKIK